MSAETDLPLTLGILLDTSGSQERVLPLEQEAGSEFLQQVLRSKDEAFLVSFDVNVDLLQDFTNSPHELAHAMNKAQINTAGGNGGGIPGLGGGPVPTVGDPKGTLLYDAIYLASTEKLNQETGRKAMIILTDGEDEGSRTKIDAAIAAAERNNVIVYVILIADRQGYWMQGMGYFGYSAAKKIADETGGRLIDVGNNGPKLQAAFAEIEDELRTQYVATYTPSNAKIDGTFRHIAVQCGEGNKVQVRRGYFANAPQNPQDSFWPCELLPISQVPVREPGPVLGSEFQFARAGARRRAQRLPAVSHFSDSRVTGSVATRNLAQKGTSRYYRRR